MRCTIVPAAVLLFIAASAAADPSPTIYRCETASGITFSDRPCGADSRPYVVDTSSVSVVETVVPEARAATSRARPQAPSRARSSTESSKAEICGRIDRSLRKILSTMRTGYTASQGERLKERKRELQAQRRAQKC